MSAAVAVVASLVALVPLALTCGLALRAAFTREAKQRKGIVELISALRTVTVVGMLTAMSVMGGAPAAAALGLLPGG